MVEEATITIAAWTEGTTDTDRIVEEAWRERWLRERNGRATTRPADDLDHQRETIFKDKTLKRHTGLNKAKSSLLIQIRTGDIGLRDFLFKRGVPGIITPSCECGEGVSVEENLGSWLGEMGGQRKGGDRMVSVH